MQLIEVFKYQDWSTKGFTASARELFDYSECTWALRLQPVHEGSSITDSAWGLFDYSQCTRALRLQPVYEGSSITASARELFDYDLNNCHIRLNDGRTDASNYDQAWDLDVIICKKIEVE